MKLGIVDVGGGLRGIYAAGVLDRCLDADVKFDLCIGVSAGSANLGSFLAGQRGRNYRFYLEYAFRREYMSFGNFLRARSYIDLDYVYGTLSTSKGEYPYDYRRCAENPAAFEIVATNAWTGEAKYFSKGDLGPDNLDPLKASSAIPAVCRPYEVGGVPYYDGALSDPVPVDRALALGCDAVVLLLTRPRDFIRTPERDARLAAWIEGEFPVAAKKFRLRAETYNRAVARAKEYEAEGRAIIVAPADTCGIGTLTRDKSALRRLYARGYEDGRGLEARLRALGKRRDEMV